MKSCITSTQFITTDTSCIMTAQARKGTVRICKVPLAYRKELNAFMVDLELPSNNLILCGTYLYLKYIIGGKKPVTALSHYI